jgi:hypothetical protein
MSENSLLSVKVSFEGDKIYVAAKIVFDKPLKNITFILNNSLTIDKIEHHEYPIIWEKIEELKPEFRSLSQKIRALCEHPITELLLIYHGPIKDSWYNVITEEIKSLSMYSVWFPQELPLKNIEDRVVIKGDDDLFVVKGIFDNEKRIWYYGGRGYDPFNIIVYKKSVLKISSNDHLNIYYVDPEIGKYVNTAKMAYKNILNFYKELFAANDFSVLDVACVSPALTAGGGYRRKDLMFCTNIGDNDLYITWFFAHETAHNWCNGADASTWEDWLNETTAEWASLLYALNKNDDILFHYILDRSLENISRYPPIKTVDGSRPEGVHSKGTALFYELYLKHGKDVLTKMIQGFAELKIKNTENFVNLIKYEISKDAAEEIEQGIEK